MAAQKWHGTRRFKHSKRAHYPEDDDYDSQDDFRDPGGRSALRAGRRNRPCPTCGKKNALTERDVELGYQCDDCADKLEGRLPDASY